MNLNTIALIPLLVSLITYHLSLITASAAVPLKWTVETSRVQPATFDAYQGETIDFEAALQSYGKPLAAPSEYAIYWQTNGMGNAWWSRPCVTTASSPSAPTNVLFATWTPDMDVGGKAYTCFIGQPGTVYHAAFQLRLRPSPGALPNELPLPQKVIDFGKVTVLNPPWPDVTVTNGLRRVDDMAVYAKIVRPEGPWTWHCPHDPELESYLNGERIVPCYEEQGGWNASIHWGGYNEYDFGWGGADAETVDFTHSISGLNGPCTATREAKLIPTSDRLATTNGVRKALAAKRDLDDLSYVTQVQGGWEPTEVDGHRYDIRYDGDSGWIVAKMTYYPEWGEWYYDDSEFVSGPEDAEALTAHKIWSDETITFTRQQVEVTDSLALVSQIGNQAEVAARNYIQNNDIAKTKTLLRTGKPGEYGTGWGTMHYQFSSDRRWWSMIVPSLTASWSAGGYVDASGTYVEASTVKFPGSSYAYYRADPISQRDHTPIARFVSSSGTNGSARCSTATWSVGITAGTGTSSSSVKFDNSADLDAMPFLVTVDVDHAAGFGAPTFEGRSSVPPMEFNLQDYYQDHYVLSNFRYGEATVTDGSVSVKCLYDVDVSNSSNMRASYTAWCTLNLGCSAEIYTTTNPDYGRILTDTTRGLYYDKGLKATWRVNVTNGCFFAEVISTNNLSEGVN